MKYLLIFSMVLAYACSPVNNASPRPQYVSPGTFTGTWTIEDAIATTTHCTAIVVESDSFLHATITNDSTKEILTIFGILSIPVDSHSSLHFYGTSDSSSIFGDTDKISKFQDGFYFSADGNSLLYTAQRGVNQLSISCQRE